MSLTAMVWALKQAPVDDPQSVLVLIALADHAAEDGTSTYPSRATIGQYARCSTRTVQRRLNELEKLGVIERGDQEILASRNIPADRRPTVWNLKIDIQRGDSLSQRGDTPGITGCHARYNGVTGQVERGDTGGTQTSINQHSNQNNNHNAGEDFDQWWSTYPKKVGKGAAKKSYLAALKKTTVETLASSVASLAKEFDSRSSAELRFCPNASTWLNQERWTDELVAAPSGDRLAELIEARDVYGIEALTGVKIVYPDFGDVSPREASLARQDFFDEFVKSHENKLRASSASS